MKIYNKMSEVTIIIPIHEYNGEIKKHFLLALNSINRQEKYNNKIKTILVAPTKIISDIVGVENNYNNLDILFLHNNNETDFQSQINFAVESVETKYFSVLEFDDELSNKYFKNVDSYIKSMPDVDIFLAMMVEVTNDGENSIINKYTNENVWSHQFVGETGEVGYLNLNSLKEYSDFKLSGAVIRKSEFINIGGYKRNIKMTFGYELLLRALNNSCKIYTIPRIIYKHLINREGSLFDIYSKTLPKPERKFWFDVANKEYHFIKDREIDTSILK